MADVDTAPWVALERLQTLPLAIDDVTSVLLTVFTIAFGVAALLTGLATDDRFPGYGAATRAHRAARNQLEALRQGHLSAIDAIFRPAPAHLSAITAEATGVTETYRRTVESLKRSASSLEHALENVAAGHRQAVLTARESFARVSGQPVPATEPSPLPAGESIGQVERVIAEAKATLAGFPTRLARLELERTVAETRLQQQYAAALEHAPAFFALTEQRAETESDHDEVDGAKALARQRSLWTEAQDRNETEQTSGNEAGPAADMEGDIVPPPRKGNGAAAPEDRAA